MGRLNSIIVKADTPNLSAHTYTQIYGGTAGCTMVVNGVSLSVGPASTLDLMVGTVTGGAGCYLLGTSASVYSGSPMVG